MLAVTEESGADEEETSSVTRVVLVVGFSAETVDNCRTCGEEVHCSSPSVGVEGGEVVLRLSSVIDEVLVA